jgi:prevent-host-death family protein
MALFGTINVSVAEAKNKLPELIQAVEDGESVTICRGSVPVADLVRTTKAGKHRRRLGTFRDKVVIKDPDWWKPMTDDEADAF